jgi:hypothetical protein
MKPLNTASKTGGWRATRVLIALSLLACAPLGAGVRTLVQPEDGFNDEPSMAVAADGSLYVAWVSFRDGSDTLQLARYRLENGRLQRYGA